MIDLLSTSILAAALGCGLIAGVFFAFSIFIMKALAALPPAQGIAAMQSINVVVINPWFLGVFLGAGVVCLCLAASSLLAWNRPGATCLLAGCVLYLVGTVGVTMVFNVPRNNALAAVDPATAEAAKIWTEYVRSWTAWNTVRTIAALAAAALLTVAFRASNHPVAWQTALPEISPAKHFVPKCPDHAPLFVVFRKT
jgi:uncharacterized membrane protein